MLGMEKQLLYLLIPDLEQDNDHFPLHVKTVSFRETQLLSDSWQTQQLGGISRQSIRTMQFVVIAWRMGAKVPMSSSASHDV